MEGGERLYVLKSADSGGVPSNTSDHKTVRVLRGRHWGEVGRDSDEGGFVIQMQRYRKDTRIR